MTTIEQVNQIVIRTPRFRDFIGPVSVLPEQHKECLIESRRMLIFSVMRSDSGYLQAERDACIRGAALSRSGPLAFVQSYGTDSPIRNH